MCGIKLSKVYIGKEKQLLNRAGLFYGSYSGRLSTIENHHKGTSTDNRKRHYSIKKKKP
jgi:hypothetical protein